MSATVKSGLPFEQESNTFPWVEVRDYRVEGWHAPAPQSRALTYCRLLEQGNILLFRRPPFGLPARDRQELLEQQAGDSRLHKNVSYRPQQDLLRGFGGASGNRARVHEILRNYSRSVTEFAARFLTPYAGRLSRDYASFRPVEEEGRALPLHKRNDLLHVDAFPSRPTHGGRILRVFTNIHPFRDRVWRISNSFESVAERYGKHAGLRTVNRNETARHLGRWLRRAGLPVRDRSPYDKFMLRFHDYLKENGDYQARSGARYIAFPPGSTWMVYTDAVAHAVLSGQFALEQTFIVPISALVSVEASPIRILERIAGRALA